MLHVERFCIRIHCTLYYTYLAAALYIVTVAVPRVCVCLFVYSFLPPRASTPRNIGAYVFTATRKTLYSYSNRAFLLKMLRSEATAGVIHYI